VYQYEIAEVRQIISGDTVAVKLDLGFGLFYSVEVRLSNVETQKYGPKGNQARTFTEKWLAPEHGPFIVHTSKDRRGNIEAQIFNSEGADLGDDLIAAELGRPYGS